jgi:hypothetical protein
MHRKKRGDKESRMGAEDWNEKLQGFERLFFEFIRTRARRDIAVLRPRNTPYGPALLQRWQHHGKRKH